MPLYLCSIVGTGSTTDPFRPVSTQELVPGWIDLRPDVTVAAGFGIVELPATSDPNLRLIADDPAEPLSVTSQTLIGNRLGLTLVNRFTVADMLRELLEDHARLDGTRWKPLRSRVTGAADIHLGGRRIYTRPGLARRSSQDFTETWPTNSTTLSSGQDHAWTELNEDSEVSGGVLRKVATAAPPAHLACDSTLDTDDHAHTASFALVLNAGGGNQLAVSCRDDAAAAAAADCYAAHAFRQTGFHVRRLIRLVAGATTSLASDATDPGASGTIAVYADGSSIRGVVGGFDQTVTDTNVTGNTKVGVRFLRASQVIGEATLDSHHFYDIVPSIFAAGYQQYYRRLIAC